MKPWKNVVLALAIAIGILTGCSDHGEVYEKLTATEVGEHIQQEQAASLNGLQRRDAEQLKKLYHIEASDVADFVLYTATSNVKADELTIIKVKEASEIDSVMARIQQRIEAQTFKFKDYRPEEYNLIQKHVLKSKGPFVFFAVSKDSDHMELAFDDAFNRIVARMNSSFE